MLLQKTPHTSLYVPDKSRRRKQYHVQTVQYKLSYVTSDKEKNLPQSDPRYDDAIFLLNSGFVKIISSLSNYDSAKPIEPWMKVIMINVAIDEFRKNKKYEENNILLDDLDWSKLSDNSKSIDENAVIDTEEYWSLVRNIPDPAGTVFNLFVVDNFGHKEIAQRLEISERSSKRYLRQAREWLLNKIKMNHVSVKQYG